MSFYKRRFLNHLKALQPALARLGAQAFIDPSTLVLRARVGETKCVLRPQFMTNSGGIQYIPTFNADVRRFVGWCPYAIRRWPLASEKLLFKRFAMENSIRTPEYSTDPGAAMNDVIVKRSVSSFAFAIRGPFHASSECPLDAAAGEYFERFVRGMIAKIWYWNDRPVCLELEQMPFVRGTGLAPIRRLARRRLRRPQRWGAAERIADFLKYQGAALDTVLEKGAVQTVDFRYGSRFSIPAFTRDVDLTVNMTASLESQLLDIGRKLWAAVAPQVHADTLFTVDAIVDAEERLWTLEMNSNPAIHPYVYPVMLDSLFAEKKETIAGAALAD